MLSLCCKQVMYYSVMMLKGFAYAVFFISRTLLVNTIHVENPVEVNGENGSNTSDTFKCDCIIS
jgi:hypothetical protein